MTEELRNAIAAADPATQAELKDDVALLIKEVLNTLTILTAS